MAVSTPTRWRSIATRPLQLAMIRTATATRRAIPASSGKRHSHDNPDGAVFMRGTCLEPERICYRSAEGQCEPAARQPAAGGGPRRPPRGSPGSLGRGTGVQRPPGGACAVGRPVSAPCSALADVSAPAGMALLPRRAGSATAEGVPGRVLGAARAARSSGVVSPVGRGGRLRTVWRARGVVCVGRLVSHLWRAAGRPTAPTGRGHPNQPGGDGSPAPWGRLQ